MAGTMDKIKAKVDNVLHKDKTHDDPTGPHSSHGANKADPRVDSDRVGPAGNVAGAQHGTHTGAHTGTGAGLTGNTHGTHTGAHTGTGAGLTGTTHGTHTGTGSGLTGNTHTTAHGTDMTGPHDSHMGNKADPRVDSDRLGNAGNTATAGGHGIGQYGSSTTHTGTTHGTHTGTGSGLTGTTHGTHTGTGSGLTGNTHTTGAYGTTHSDPRGPHDSHLTNKADPRVDSDRLGQGYDSTHTGGVTGTGTHGTTHGTHGAGIAGTHGTVGSGNSNNTAGPHNSDMLNKIDPRVDSDLDGSKTVGGNATYK